MSRKYLNSLLRAATFAPVLFIVTGCGGGTGSDDPNPPATSPPPAQGTVITSGNYVDVAGVAIVAANRIQFAIDVVDAAFETAIRSGGIPGTYPCVYSGTVAYTQSASTYTFTVSNCDTLVGGRRAMLQSGSLRIANPIVQTTSAGYFLTSAQVTFNNAKAVESGASSIYGGAANLSSTVTSSTTAVATVVGASMTVERAGRVDTYSNINMTANVTFSGNLITGGSLSLSSPRAPGLLTLSAGASTLTATAADNSQSVLSTSDYINYTLKFVADGTTQTTSTGNVNSGSLALAIAKALQ